MRPDISIIIVNWNTCELLRECLQSIYATAPPVDFEVLVVDNASSDGSADMVANEFPDAVLMRSATNTGFTTGNNIGIQKASGRYILLLNPDAELLPGSVQAMFDFAESHPDAAVIGPKLLNTDGSLQKNGRRFTRIYRELLAMVKLHKLAVTLVPEMEWGRRDFDTRAQVDEVSGACMLVRRAAIDKVGMLDERFFMYYEEVDWCRRFKDAGFTVWYLPEAEVIHHWAQGSRKAGLATSHIAFRSQYLYYRKHHGFLQAATLRAVSGVLLLLLHVKYALKGRLK
ncbi:MAG: glycosyltransferase family 2 protein [Armatimonadota bacterium]|jgi:N-acetylglucosaminyl-diphospho-decaprenol L-rhamnosyltransferase|nr:glycosyltransferase family 2 protein [Armatimonadota bacterium]